MSHAPALLAQALALLAPASPLALRAAFGWNYYGVKRAADLALTLTPRCEDHGDAVEVLAPSAELRVIVSVPTGPSAKYSAPLRVELVDLLADGDAARYTPVDLDGLDDLAARLAQPRYAPWGLKVSPRTFQRLDLARYATLEGDCAWFAFDRDAVAQVLYALGAGGLAVRCARSEYTPGGPSRAALDRAEFEARWARWHGAPAPVEVVEVVEVEAPAPVEVSPLALDEARRAPLSPLGASRWFAVSAEAAPALRACGYAPTRGAVCLPVSALRSLAPRLRALAGAWPAAPALAADIERAIAEYERAALAVARR